jgi:hypothetical protein
LGRLEDGRVKLTEFVRNAKHGQGILSDKQQGPETGLSSTEQKDGSRPLEVRHRGLIYTTFGLGTSRTGLCSETGMLTRGCDFFGNAVVGQLVNSPLRAEELSFVTHQA